MTCRAMPLLGALLGAAALTGCSLAQSGKSDEAALALRGVMRDMGRDLVSATDALLRDDYYAVERSAARLVGHAQPPVEERVRIITWLGSEAARFKGYDDEVQAHARALGAAAREREPRQAAKALGSLQSACIGCHVEFRGRLMRQFYPARPAS